VAEVVEAVCRKHYGAPLPQMATSLITAFFEAKMRSMKTSVALYSVSSDVDGAKIVRQMGGRFLKAVTGMLESAHEPLTTDPRVAASMLQGAMVGVSRSLLESGSTEKQLDASRRELIFLACAYLDASRARPAVVRSAGVVRQAR
jgi:hypothetical protein